MSVKSVPAVEPAGATETATPQDGSSGPGGGAVARLRERPILFGAAGLLLCSAALVYLAGTRPGFDPYGWLVWGHQTLHWSLNTNGAPSWKPLPYLFTVPFALTGHLALRLWMVTSAAISLAGVISAGRIAFRLTDAPPERRWPGYVAALFAGAGVLGIADYLHYILSSQSDTVIVSCCLGSVDAYLSGRRKLAFWLAVLASLGRPEAWPFVGLLGLWLARSEPNRATRITVVAGFIAIAALWFGIPALTADSPFVAGNLALHSSRALHGNKIIGTFGRFHGLMYWPVFAAAAVGALMAWRRRDRVALVLTGIAVTWVLVEAGFALHGWPAIPRYMFEAAAFLVVIAAVAVGWLLSASPSLPRLAQVPRWLGPVLVGLLAVALVPGAVSRLQKEHKDIYRERNRARQIARLGPLATRLGGLTAIQRCGQPATEIEFQSVMAWTLGINVGDVGYYPTRIVRPHPQVLFRSANHGWRVKALHVSPALRAACAPMHGRTRTR